jgi:CPA2 family monovalent cation:H+ antiporter-2
MFYMGLEFDLKKLRQLFGPAILALIFQTFFMLFLGRVLAPIFGWGGLNGLFLGGLLAISSSMITLPILAEQNALRKNYGRLCMGILIFEDILAILLLVILSGIAITGYFDWDAVGRITFLVGAFVVSIFIAGRMLAPQLIVILRKFNSEELFTIVIIGFLLAIGLFAEISHFSTALGAFLAGAIFSDSEIAEAIERHTQPIRTLFTAIFFLSVGMMASPRLLVEYLVPIILLTALVFSLKVLSCFAGLFFSGQSGEDSFCASVGKAQIGEFSFVIAALGTSLGVTNDSLINVAIGVSLGTIFCTTLLSPRAKKIHGVCLRFLPGYLLRFGKIYQDVLAVIRSRISQNTLLKLAGKPLTHIVINVFLFFSVSLVASLAVRATRGADFLGEWIPLAAVGIWAIAALISLPILLPIVRQVNVLFLALIENALSSSQSRSRRFIAPRLGGLFQSAIFAIIFTVFGGIFLSVAAPTLPKGVPLYAFLLLLLVVGLLFRRRVLQFNARVENYFIETFNRDITSQLERHRRIILKKIRGQSPLQLDLLDVRILEGNCGHNLRICDLGLREKFNVNIVALRHGNYTTFSPPAEMPLFAGSGLILLGSRENLEKARGFFLAPCECAAMAEGAAAEEFEIAHLCVHLRHPLLGKTLMESQLRKKYGVSVVEIRRNGGDVLLPSAAEIFQANDVLVIVGGRSAIRRASEAWDSDVAP